MGRIRLYKKIGEWDKIPKFYGVAYIRPDMCGSICYPIPINLIVRLFYNLHCRIYRFFKMSGYPKRLNKIIMENYQAGYDKAKKEFKNHSIKCWVCKYEIFAFPEPKNHPQYEYKYWPCPQCGSDIFAMIVVDRLNSIRNKYNKGNSDALQAEGQNNLPL